MTLKKRFGIATLSIMLAVGALEFGSAISIPGVSGAVTPAHAIIGRPLTPLSVAGVARRTSRRTVRRCMRGVGFC